MSRGPNQAGEIYVAIKGDTTDLNQKVQDASRTAQEQNQRNAGGVGGGGSLIDGLSADVTVASAGSAATAAAATAVTSFTIGKSISELALSMGKFEAALTTIADLMQQQNAFSQQILTQLQQRGEGSTVEGFGKQLSEEIATAQNNLASAEQGIADRGAGRRLWNTVLSALKVTKAGRAWDQGATVLEAVGLDIPTIEADSDGLDAKFAESQNRLRQLRQRQDALRQRTNEQTLKGLGEQYGIDTSGISYAPLSQSERAAITFGGVNGNASEIVNTLVEIRKINEAMEQSLKRLSTAPLAVISKPERDQGDNK